MARKVDREYIETLFDDQEKLEGLVEEHYRRVEEIIGYGVVALIALATIAVGVLAWIFGP
jgi:hypothetical protein